MEATQVVMATFPTEDGAEKAVEQLEAMAKAGSIEIIEAAVINRNAEGETEVRQVSLPSTKSWAGKGALIGGIVGVIFPPAIIGSALIGAGLGAGSAALTKYALKNDELEEAANELEPGTSSFIAVLDQTWVKELAKAMEGYDKLAEHTLDATTAANLEMIADEAAGVAAISGEMYAETEDGVVAAEVDSVTDLKTGSTYSEGSIVATDGDVVVGESFAELEVPIEVPDAVGGFEADAAGELESGEDEDE